MRKYFDFCINREPWEHCATGGAVVVCIVIETLVNFQFSLWDGGAVICVLHPADWHGYLKAVGGRGGGVIPYTSKGKSQSHLSQNYPLISFVLIHMGII